MFTLDQLEFVADTFFSPFGDVAGINLHGVAVHFFGDDEATTKSNLYSCDNRMADNFTCSRSKVDGRWRSTGTSGF